MRAGSTATRSILVVVLAAATAVAAVACGSGQKGPAGPGQRKEAAIVQQYPVARKVPANASYFVAVARLDQGVQAVRDFLRPFGRFDSAADPVEIDRILRAGMGWSLLSPADLVDAGFAIDRNIAVYSSGVFPTVLVPVADQAKVTQALQKLAQGERSLTSEVRGHAVTVIGDDYEYAAWVISDGWLAIHFGDPKLDPANAWVESWLGLSATLATEADLDWLAATVQKQGLIGLLRGPAFFAAARALDRPESKNAACDAKHAAVAGVIGRVAVGALLGDGRIDGEGFVELSAGAASALAAHTAPAPDAAFRAVRAEAAVGFGLGVDLTWFGEAAAGAAGRDCGFAGEIAHELADLRDPVQDLTGQRAFDGYHVALLGGSVGFGGADITAAAWAHVVDEGAVTALMSQLGQYRVIQVEGQEVRETAVPGLAAPLEWQLGGGVLRAAVGRGVMPRLLAAASGDGPRELFGLVLRPDKVPDLVGALAFMGREAQAAAELIGEYKQAGISFTLGEGGVRVAGGFELR